MTLNSDKSVSIDGTTINPDTYFILVSHSKNTVTTDPSTPSNVNISALGNGAYVSNIIGGSQLNDGPNIITFTVTAEDGSTQDYSIPIVRESQYQPSSVKTFVIDATMFLDPNGNNITVSHSKNTVTTDPSTPYNVNIRASASDVGAYISNIIGGSQLNDGPNIITFTVTAEDGSTQECSITINRNFSLDDTSLSTFTINNIDVVDGDEKTVYVDSVNVVVVTSNSNSTINYDFSNPVGLNVGSNTITFIVTAEDTTTTRTYIITVNRSVLVCFKEGSKILTDQGYRLIEELRPGDLVKTELNDYKPIVMIGKKEIYHHADENRIKDQLYQCSPQQYPELTDELIVTGCHCILVDDLTDEQRTKSIDVHGKIYITGNKYRLPACVDERTSVYDKKGNHIIYHLALENEHYYKNYGIYANGLLVETCSKRYLKELSNMELHE